MATQHWQDKFSTRAAAACNHRALGLATTTDPELVTCGKTACQQGKQRAIRDRAISERVDHTNEWDPAARAETPEGALVALIWLPTGPIGRWSGSLADPHWYLDGVTYEDARALHAVLKSVMATLHARDRERIDEAEQERWIAEYREEQEE